MFSLIFESIKSSWRRYVLKQYLSKESGRPPLTGGDFLYSVCKSSRKVVLMGNLGKKWNCEIPPKEDKLQFCKKARNRQQGDLNEKDWMIQKESSILKRYREEKARRLLSFFTFTIRQIIFVAMENGFWRFKERN